MSELAGHRGGTPPATAEGRRVVSCDLAFQVVEPSEVVLQIMASASAGRVRAERFEVRVDGEPAPAPVELAGPHGARVQVFHSPAGSMTVSYRSELDTVALPTGRNPGRAAATPDGGPWNRDADLLRLIYLRSSRYCPSDHLVGFGVAEFGTASTVRDRVEAITDWIRGRVGYVAGSSSVHDSAEDTLLTGMGTCRDFAHLGVALCRAVGIPARFAAVYAPGLSPMDFHAVFEARHLDGRWYAYDATDLAPRQSMVRIVTGRDAADAAFASVNSGIATLGCVAVTATTGGDLPVDDPSLQVELA
ncbi:MAG: transglutaminase family protein [Acidimicrobiales bacterium]